MGKKLLFILVLGGLVLTGCSGIQIGNPAITGSGHVTSEPRNVSGFTSISLEGSGNVQVAFGDQESVVVEAEDNLLPLIETFVQGQQLIIREKPLTSISATQPINISITMKSLDGVTLAGSGNITVPGLNGDSLKVALPGSGTVRVGGTVNQVDLSLGGSGNIYCDGLKAKTATANLNGSGNITVFASESLNAAINGSGSIRYSGNPASVNKTVRGSGSIQEQGS